jgi:hypothetical protein
LVISAIEALAFVDRGAQLIDLAQHPAQRRRGLVDDFENRADFERGDH